MKKSVICCLTLMMILAFALKASSDIVVSSKHDFSITTGIGSFQFDAVNVCSFCHTPHHANPTAPVLWNRSLKTSSNFTLYSSVQHPGIEAAQNLDTTKYSLLCLSCHDGSTAINTVINKQGDAFTQLSLYDQIGDVTNPVDPIYGMNIGGFDAAGAPLAGNPSLRNDHPVGFAYTAALIAQDRQDTGHATDQLATPNASGYVGDQSVRLFGSSRNVLEYGTCHNPHDNQFGKFLVKSNANSDLCRTCHLK